MNASTAVIILNWNNAFLTIECVNSWLKHNNGSIDIFIIDNGSNIEEKAILLSYVENINGNIIYEDMLNNVDLIIEKNIGLSITIVLLKQNYGYAKGNNFGLELALQKGYEFSIICNNDIILPDEFNLNSLIKCMSQDDRIALVGPKVINKNDGSIQEPFYNKPNILYPSLYQLFYPIAYPIYKSYKLINNHQFSNQKYVYSVSGCFMLLNNKFLSIVGLLDETTFLYGEEYILGEKISKEKLKAYYYPHSWVIHAHAVSTRNLFKKEFHRAKEELKSIRYYYEEYRQYNKASLILIWLCQMVFSIVYFPLINLLKRSNISKGSKAKPGRRSIERCQ